LKKNIKNAVCTIASKNYLHYARTLRDSFLKYNPDIDFFILFVDEINDDFDIKKESCEIIQACDLGIENFNQIAFKYNIVEFNTSIKPYFLRYLQTDRGYKNVMYLDPDIEVFQSLDFIFNLLDKHSMVVTPHITKPIEDNLKPKENDFLRSGVFNLGFIAVGNSKESIEFLTWWKLRLLKFSYNEPRNGLFTDQKWTNFIPCLFDNYYILKDEGCNVAYWNFHQRILSQKDGKYFINDTPLKFFHFSGLNVKHDTEISKYQNRYDLKNRKDLYGIFTDYRKKLINNGYEDAQKFSYTYGVYTNGVKVSNLARKLFASNLEMFENENPFDYNSNFYKWAMKKNLIDNSEKLQTFTTMNYNAQDRRLKVIHFILKLTLKIVGVHKYEALMKYFSYISILRNQKEVFK